MAANLRRKNGYLFQQVPRIVRKNTGVDLSLHVHEMNRARRSWYSGGIHVLRAKHE